MSDTVLTQTDQMPQVFHHPYVGNFLYTVVRLFNCRRSHQWVGNNSVSEVTTLWHYTNLFIIIIIIKRQQSSTVLVSENTV